jgi:N6-adenosine-specific RNA methylase IME4
MSIVIKAVLSAEEQADLQRLEGIIEANMAAFDRCLEALIEFHAKRLYRATHTSFDAYCRERWNFSRQRAEQLRDWIEVRASLAATMVAAPEINERQARALKKAPEEERGEVYQEAERRHGRAPTGRELQEVIEERQGAGLAADERQRTQAFLDDHRARQAAAAATPTLQLGTPKPVEEPVARGEKEILRKAAELRQAQAQQKKDQRTAMHREVAANNQALDFKDRRFAVIEADCPWEHDNTGVNGAAEKHYPTMPTDEICQLPVARHATENAVLFLWATNAMLQDAEDVMAAWGFDYKTAFVWVKSGDATDPDAVEELAEVVDDRNGTGWYNKQDHELLLVGVRGGNMTPVKRFSSVIVAPRGKHSEKPDKAYEIIEAMYPDAPRLGLFRRSAREGWTPWGNQVDTIDVEASRVEPATVPKATINRGMVGWPAGVMREEYKAWKAAQEAKGVTENINPQEYKRMRDLGLAGIAQPTLPAKDKLKPPANRQTPGEPETVEAPNGKAVVLKPDFVPYHLSHGPVIVGEWNVQTPKGRAIGDLSQDEDDRWSAVVNYRRSPRFHNRSAALAWVYARDKYCGGTSVAQEEAREEAEARYGVDKALMGDGYDVIDRTTNRVVDNYRTKTEARQHAEDSNRTMQEFASAGVAV